MNIISILVAAAVGFIVGFLIHGPLFGKTWMRLAGIHPTGNEKFSDMIPQMVQNYIANVVSAGVLSLILNISFGMLWEASWYRAVVITFILWLGFVVTNSSMEVIWMKRKFWHWAFDAAAALCVMVAMSLTLLAW
jgi:hypothetical protein